jgi:hypothetical protein
VAQLMCNLYALKSIGGSGIAKDESEFHAKDPVSDSLLAVPVASGSQEHEE